MANPHSSYSGLAPLVGFVGSLTQHVVDILILAAVCWALFFVTGVVISSVRVINYRSILSLHAGLLIAYLLSIVPADLLLHSILGSVVFQISIKFIGKIVGPVFVLRKPVKVTENVAMVVLATISLIRQNSTTTMAYLYHIRAILVDLGLYTPQPYDMPTSITRYVNEELDQKLLLALFSLFVFVARFIDHLSFGPMAATHIVAYAICSITNFPLDVAADVLISTFVIITSFKIIFGIIGLFGLGGLARLVFLLIAACAFFEGPQLPKSLWGSRYWFYAWNDIMRDLHFLLVTAEAGISGIMLSIIRKDGYNTSMFYKSAALFAVIRAEIQVVFEQMLLTSQVHGENV
ncbi:hypothetical protein VTL71DRAFT_12411 [Oculimacula yallundae]|uniref:Integral membrane protein n=1 Tax=Oculimacula yallundae TaxID=86028 RepID=A0ABR4CPN6_9HELO